MEKSRRPRSARQTEPDAVAQLAPSRPAETLGELWSDVDAGELERHVQAFEQGESCGCASHGETEAERDLVDVAWRTRVRRVLDQREIERRRTDAIERFVATRDPDLLVAALKEHGPRVLADEQVQAILCRWHLVAVAPLVESLDRQAMKQQQNDAAAARKKLRRICPAALASRRPGPEVPTTNPRIAERVRAEVATWQAKISRLRRLSPVLDSDEYAAELDALRTALPQGFDPTRGEPRDLAVRIVARAWKRGRDWAERSLRKAPGSPRSRSRATAPR